MKGLAGLVILASAALLLPAALVQSAPKPSVIPVSWQIDIKYQSPMAIVLRPPGESKPRTYWYVLYTVTNNSGADHLYVPSFTLYTDTGQVLYAGASVSPSVFEAIKTRHNNPLLKDRADISSKLLQGEDNARDGVAIFTDIDPAARSFDIYAGGLSGETVRVKLPVPIETTEQVDGETRPVTRDSVLLHKTLKLTYALPGEAAARLNNLPQLVSEEWVMR